MIIITFKNQTYNSSGKYDTQGLCESLTKNGVLLDTNIFPTIADTLATTADLIISCLTYNRYLQVRGMYNIRLCLNGWAAIF